MAFTDMNEVEQELGEEQPPDKNGNRTFMIIAGILGGIMLLALLCIAGLALTRYLPGQQSAQSANATNEAQATAIAVAASQTASAPLPTATKTLLIIPTNTTVPTNTPVIALGPTKTPGFDSAMATIFAMRTQKAQSTAGTPMAPTSQPTSSQPTPAQPTSKPSATALPGTGIAEELGGPGLITIAFVLVVVIFVMRRLRTAP